MMDTTVEPVEKAFPSIPQRPRPVTRRMELADINEHGLWLFPRLQAAFPKLNPSVIPGWLTQQIYENTSIMLYQQDAVVLAQLIRAHAAEPVPVVRETFLYVRDPEDVEQITAAMGFYDEIERYTKLHDASTYIISARSDIKPEMLRKRFERVFEAKQYFVRMD